MVDQAEFNDAIRKLPDTLALCGERSESATSNLLNRIFTGENL